MAITFKNPGHVFATFFKKAAADAKVVGADLVKAIAVVEDHKSEVEAVTGAVAAATGNAAAAPVAVSIEDAGFAVLGELSSVISAGGSAASAKLLDAGLDKNLITLIEQLVAGSKQVATLVSKL